MRIKIHYFIAINFLQILVSCTGTPNNDSSDIKPIEHLFTDNKILEKREWCHWENINLSDPRGLGPTDTRMIIVIKPNPRSLDYISKYKKDSVMSFVDTSYVKPWMPATILSILKGKDNCWTIKTTDMITGKYKSSAVISRDGYILLIID